MPDPVLDPSTVGRQLAESLATMQWATSLVPVRWIHHVPETAPADAWTVAMNVAHLVTYERCIGLPLLENLAQGGDGAGAIESPFEQSFFADAQRLAGEPIEALMASFEELREREVSIVERYAPDRFNLPVTDAFNSGTHGPNRHSAASGSNRHSRRR